MKISFYYVIFSGRKTVWSVSTVQQKSWKQWRNDLELKSKADKSDLSIVRLSKSEAIQTAERIGDTIVEW